MPQRAEVRVKAETREQKASVRHHSLKKIVIDLTPMLPGGENGGIKIVIFELIKYLASSYPDTEFVLLTHEMNFDELEAWERENVKRYLLPLATSQKLLRRILRKMARVTLALLPNSLKIKMGSLGFGLNRWLKRSKTSTMLKDLGTNVLFCPFGAPTYYESGIPTICTISDIQYTTYPEFFSDTERACRHQAFVDACRCATALAVISDYTRQTIIQQGMIAPEKVNTIHLQLGQRMRDEAFSDHILSDLGLTPQQYLLYPANFWKHKNHEMLFTALGIVLNQHAMLPIKLVCTGSGSNYQSMLQQALARMGLQKHVIFAGYLSNTELNTLISKARGVIFPSLYEGFGLPVIEAMVAGIPVACSNVTALPEVVDDAALLFNPALPHAIADAMLALWCDDALRRALIQKGYARAHYFSSTKRMAQEYWDLFNRCTAS